MTWVASLLSGFSSSSKDGMSANAHTAARSPAIMGRIIVCEKIIDAQAYQDGVMHTYANNYAYSTIRKWLNENFLNTALEITTLYSPEELLNVVNDIEARLDRVRTIKWGPRTLDIDIIFYDDIIMNTKDLIIPHKEMHLREFVLKPLMELNRGYVHPLIGKNVYMIYEDLKKHVQKFY